MIIYDLFEQMSKPLNRTMKVYLYIKQHKVTGLKYFGQTHHNDPAYVYTYTGSGSYWVKHLKTHGGYLKKDRHLIETIQVWEFEDQQSATRFAREFSEKNMIVERQDWANLIPEDAVQGASLGNKNGSGNRGKTKTTAHKQRIAKSATGRPRQDMLGNKFAVAGPGGRTKSVEHQEAITQAINSPEVKQKIRNTWDSKPLIQCPHCGIQSRSKSNMNRYHIDNCSSLSFDRFVQHD